ncbi:flagellar assembly protein FliW [Lentibacillus cibarius]|uniref:Flagellar assembly factor FliW n=1 Tax=Lentibacillus cibarius TaxID=2583219 RepID=A0A549YED8_9BACI|nr:flagellar assembly protein FliW [Lentibacillus cibarius]TRM10232.1 flagellar assembly protein FliW [Lentibacillus cibarius]
MYIQTKYFGEMDVDENSIIHFSTGLPGFPDEREFVLINLSDTSIYQVLQSINNKVTAFIVVNPYDIYQDYVVDLDDSLVEALQITDEDNVVVMSVVTLKSPFEYSTLNLKAPLIINYKNRQGKQYIIDTDDYSIKAAIDPRASSSVKGE